MARKDYIEKITQNLEHLTKNELKDVATLTNAQFGVRLKVAEKEYWGKEVINLKSQLQQQALPVVPECVGEFVSGDETELSKADRIAYLLKSVEGDNYYLEKYLTNAGIISQEQGEHFYAWATNQTHETILELWNGFKVEKPQLFRVCLLDGRHTLTRRDPRKTLPFNYTFLWSYSSELKEMREINRKVDLFTEQEIKSIDERYWQFAVPVEDGE